MPALDLGSIANADASDQHISLLCLDMRAKLLQLCPTLCDSQWRGWSGSSPQAKQLRTLAVSAGSSLQRESTGSQQPPPQTSSHLGITRVRRGRLSDASQEGGEGSQGGCRDWVEELLCLLRTSPFLDLSFLCCALCQWKILIKPGWPGQAGHR